MTKRSLALAVSVLLVACGGGAKRAAAPVACEGAACPPPPQDGAPPPVISPPVDGVRDPPPGGSASTARSAVIADENALPGTTTWLRKLFAVDDDSAEIAGYAFHTSVSPGSPIDVAVTASVPTTFSWVLYRLGWYGGAGARELAHGGPLAAAPQPRCAPTDGTGLVQCGWAATFRIPTDRKWLSGIYLVKLTRADGFQRYVPIVLRAARGAAVRMILPTATWQAYNTWGGTSLYDVSPATTALLAPRTHAVAVSYDRPYIRDGGAGHLLRSDFSLARWLEAQSVDVEYLTDEDADRDPTAFDGARVIVLSGHDEYWSGAYRDHVDAAVARGTSLLNLGANNAYWQVRYAPPLADGRDHRVIVAYKEYARPSPGWAGDPVGPTSPLLTVKFRDPPVNRPENALLGVMYAGLFNEFAFPAVIVDPGHWALAGTGLAAGDVLPFAHGYETDDVVANGATPAGLEVLATSTGLRQRGGTGSGSTVVRRQGAAWIFSGGGIGFASLMSDQARAVPAAQKLVANVLGAMLGDPAFAPEVTFPGPQPPAPNGYARRVSTIATGLGAPVAIALYPDGQTLAVVDTNGGRVLRVSPDGTTVELCGGLSTPSGVAVDSAGVVYVADTGNRVVKRLAPSGAVTSLPGAYAFPFGLLVSGDALLVSDVGSNDVQRVDLRTGVVSRVAAGFYLPTGLASAPDGSVYVADSGNRAVSRAVGAAVQRVTGAVEGFRDGPVATAQLLPMYGVAVLGDGSVVVSDTGNYRVRRIAGGQVTTLAGSGRAGARDGGGADSDLVLPAGIAVGPDGTIYVAEAGAGSIRAITQ